MPTCPWAQPNPGPMLFFQPCKIFNLTWLIALINFGSQQHQMGCPKVKESGRIGKGTIEKRRIKGKEVFETYYN